MRSYLQLTKNKTGHYCINMHGTHMARIEAITPKKAFDALVSCLKEYARQEGEENIFAEPEVKPGEIMPKSKILVTLLERDARTGQFVVSTRVPVKDLADAERSVKVLFSNRDNTKDRSCYCLVDILGRYIARYTLSENGVINLLAW